MRSIDRAGRRALVVVLLLAPGLLAAGDVRVQEKNGNMILRGDKQGNSVLVEQTGPDTYLVTGQDGTTVNGAATAEVTGVRKTIKVLLRGGDDSFTFSGDAPGRLRVVGGPGDDVIDLQNGFIDGPLQVSTGGGNDTVMVAMDVSRTTRIVTGGGNDTVVLQGAALQRKARIGTGGGDDDVTVLDTFIGQRLRAQLGGGQDTLVIGQLAGGSFRGAGGGGADLAEDQGSHLLQSDPVLRKFETLIPAA